MFVHSNFLIKLRMTSHEITGNREATMPAAPRAFTLVMNINHVISIRLLTIEN